VTSAECLKKITDYFRFKIKIKISGKVKAIRAERNGKEVIADSGKMSIKILGFLVSDYEKNYKNKSGWGSEPTSRFMRGIYDSFVIKQKVETYEEKMKKEMGEFVFQLRDYLRMTNI
jgi:hypothetical protein